MAQVSFSFTTHRVRAWVVACEISAPPALMEAGTWRFVPSRELSELVLPTPSRKFWTALIENAVLFDEMMGRC